MRVKSKIDTWVSLTIWSTIIIMIAVIFMIPKKDIIYGYIVALPVIFLMLWIKNGTYYELRDDHLYCKSGPFFEKIKYEDIKSLKLSQNMLSSMALSRYRIEIKQHGKGYIRGTTYISPIDREEFMKDLESRCERLD